MFSFLFALFFVPLFVSGLLLVVPKSVARILVILSAFILSGISLDLFIEMDEPFRFGVPAFMNQVVAAADFLLLLYFGSVAFRRRSILVGVMTLLQLGVLIVLESMNQAEGGLQFQVDKLSVFMFLLINVISGVICIYSLRYIEDEDCSPRRKKYFLSILFGFIAVMNLLVVSDNLEYFLLFFELTTLASFLLIGFRKDDVSVRNSLTALWMNQIGGLAILLSMTFIVYKRMGAASFSTLLSQGSAPGFMLPLALLCIAALIKGAQMPFSKWLLGAMVAPTPVSALLHSSTMVKIAPFMILRLSPVLKGTPVASVIIGFTAFVFVAAAIGALAQDNFKRILAHSTIALLSLMILMGAVGTPVAVIACLTLLLFHGISKCMLFLNAGVLEKVFHFKKSSDMDRLGETGPFTSFVVVFGFMSLLLPPFGAFIGKWVGLETLGTLALHQKLLGAIVLVCIAGGSAILSLLYFKVLGLLITRSGKRDQRVFEVISPFYSGTLLVLIAFILLSVLCFPDLMSGYFVPVASQTLGMLIPVSREGWTLNVAALVFPLLPLAVAFFTLPISMLIALFVRFKNVDRAKEYACGEKIDYSFSSFYFSTDQYTPWFSAIGLLFFVALIVVAVL